MGRDKNTEQSENMGVISRDEFFRSKSDMGLICLPEVTLIRSQSTPHIMLRRCTKSEDAKTQKTVKTSLPILSVADISSEFGPDAPIIGLFGTWYDVSEFVSKHPGGDLIQDYFGYDATVVFKVWHNVHSERPSVLQEWNQWLKPVGGYKVTLNPLDRELLTVHRQLLDQGEYDIDPVWLISKITFAISLFLLSAFGVRFCVQQDWYLLRFLFAAILTLGWQQCGFLMHDAMHSILIRNWKSWTIYNVFGINVNHILGWIFGSFLFGINSNHWHETHTVHHVMTATIDNEYECLADPQLSEAVYMNTVKAFKLTGDLYKTGILQPIQDLFILNQKYLWIPISVLLGRPAIVIDSWLGERSIIQWIAFILHYTCFAVFYHFVGFENVMEFVEFYFVAAMCQGILTLQLLVSHYDKPFVTKREHIEQGWFCRQATAVKDIRTSSYFDWFFGGLQFHLVHHSLPKLPRCRYRKWSPVLKDIVRKHLDIEVDTVSFVQSVRDTLKHLGFVANEYGIWKTLQEFHVE